MKVEKDKLFIKMFDILNYTHFNRRLMDVSACYIFFLLRLNKGPILL